MTIGQDEFDPFAPFQEGRGYSPDTFYTRARNKDGHSRDWLRYGDLSGEKVSVPTWVHNAVHSIVGEYKQYRTVQDFARDALVHHAKRRFDDLKTPSPLLTRTIEQMIRMEEAERYEKRIAFHDECMHKIKSLLTKAETSDMQLEVLPLVVALVDVMEFPNYIATANEIIRKETR